MQLAGNLGMMEDDVVPEMSSSSRCILTTPGRVWSTCSSENSRAITLSQSGFLADSRGHQDSHDLKKLFFFAFH